MNELQIKIETKLLKEIHACKDIDKRTDLLKDYSQFMHGVTTSVHTKKATPA